MGSIKQGIQGSSSKAITFGIQSPKGSSFDRRPNRGDKDAVYKFDKQSGAGPSGHGNTQSKGHGKHSSIGGSSSFKPKGQVSSFGSKPSGTIKSGLSGQKKGHGA